MKVLITGASGFIGTALTQALRGTGHEPVALRRGSGRTTGPAWDPARGMIDGDALDGVDAVVHLAGSRIGPWLTDAKKTEIMASRRDGTRLISEAVAQAKPAVFVSGSAVGFYGDGGDTELTEASPRGDGFLADVVDVWERETQPAVDAGVRTVNIRTGLVVDDEGGLLVEPPFGVPGVNLLLPFKLGVGGPMGSGRQWWPWITLRDEVRAIVHCLENDAVSGPVNLVSPNPVRNRDFAKGLGKALGRPAVVPLPAFALKALVGPQFAEEAVLVSQRVIPEVLLDTGFEFSDPNLVPALESFL